MARGNTLTLVQALGVAVVAMAVAAAPACGSFGADDPGLDAGVGEASAGEGAVACVARSVTEDAGAPDAACEGPQLSDLASSDGHCGLCTHSCLTEGCVDGHCRTTEIVSFPFLANNPPALGALTPESLFYSHQDTIFRAPLGGGAGVPVFLASSVGAKILGAPFLAKGLGWTVADQGKLVSFPLVGAGAGTVVIGGNVTRVTSDGTAVYWLDNGTQVREVASDTPVFADATVATVYAMAADADGLFLMLGMKGSIAARARLVARGKDGNVREVLSLAAEVAPPVLMALDGPYLYWADILGGVWRVGKTSATKEAVMQIPPPRSFPKGLSVDAENVYLATSDDGNGGTVQASFFAAPKCGGPARLLQSDTIWAYGLFLDAAHLYWAHQAAIVRMAK